MALHRAKLGVSLFRHPCRKPLPRGEGLCMLCWLCISAIVVVCCRCVLHRLCSTTCMRPCIEPLGIHARHPCRGYITGATAPRPSKDACSQTHKATMQGRIKTAHKAVARCNGTNGCRCTDAMAQMADDMYGGYAPKQGCFGCLPKVLHDAKPAEQATLDTPFLSTIEVFRQSLIIYFKSIKP